MAHIPARSVAPSDPCCKNANALTSLLQIQPSAKPPNGGPKTAFGGIRKGREAFGAKSRAPGSWIRRFMIGHVNAIKIKLVKDIAVRTKT